MPMIYNKLPYYAKVAEGVVQDPIARPNWYFDNKVPVNDEYLANEGIYPIFDEINPALDIDKLLLKEFNYIFDEENKRVVKKYTFSRKSPVEVYSDLKKKVDDLFSEKFFQDVQYEYPGGYKWFVQLRNQNDLQNISFKGLSAMRDVAKGDIHKEHIFLDKENVLRSLPAFYMLELALLVEERFQKFKEVSWKHKHHNLKNIFTSDLAPDEKVDALLAYNINLLWE